MGRIRDMMGVGFAPLQATNINSTGNVTAAGSASQANATLLSYAVNYVTTGAGADSVVLPTAAQGSMPGDVVYVYVQSSTTGKLYPGGSDTANGVTTAIDVAQRKMVIATRTTATNWGYIITA